MCWISDAFESVSSYKKYKTQLYFASPVGQNNICVSSYAELHKRQIMCVRLMWYFILHLVILKLLVLLPHAVLTWRRQAQDCCCSSATSAPATPAATPVATCLAQRRVRAPSCCTSTVGAVFYLKFATCWCLIALRSERTATKGVWIRCSSNLMLGSLLQSIRWGEVRVIASTV